MRPDEMTEVRAMGEHDETIRGGGAPDAERPTGELPVAAGRTGPVEPSPGAGASPLPLSMPPMAPVTDGSGQEHAAGAGSPPGEAPAAQDAPPAADAPPHAATPGNAAGDPGAAGAPPPPPPGGWGPGGPPGWTPGGWAPGPYEHPARPAARRRVVAVAAAAALLAGGVGAGLGVSLGTGSSTSAPSDVPVIPSPGTSTQTAAGPSEPTAAIAKAVTPAVVDITSEVASPASQGQSQAEGTGMIITASGEVLTNNHVVENATKITVHVQGHAGSYPATVIGVNPTKDVALVQIEGFSGRLPTVVLGNSSAVAVGNPVVAIGNALGFGQQPTTVTGIVSALGRTITASDQSILSTSETLHNLIETDAPIQPGDSGGPLVDSHGQVIGMDTAAVSSGPVLGFAIPVNEARAIVQQIEKHQAVGGNILGENAFLGIFEGTSSFGNLGGFGNFGGLGGSGSASAVSGVSVSDVAIGGPAQAAGIAAGDTITAVGSTPTPSIAALQKVISAHKPGDQVTVTFVDTTGTSHTATVTLAGIPK